MSAREKLAKESRQLGEKIPSDPSCIPQHRVSGSRLIFKKPSHMNGVAAHICSSIDTRTAQGPGTPLATSSTFPSTSRILPQAYLALSALGVPHCRHTAGSLQRRVLSAAKSPMVLSTFLKAFQCRCKDRDTSNPNCSELRLISLMTVAVL